MMQWCLFGLMLMFIDAFDLPWWYYIMAILFFSLQGAIDVKDKNRS